MIPEELKGQNWFQPINYSQCPTLGAAEYMSK